MQKIFEEYGGVIAISIAIIGLVLVAAVLFTGSGGGVIGESIQTVINDANDASKSSPTITETSNNVLMPVAGVSENMHFSAWAETATILDFDSSYDDSLELVKDPLKLYDDNDRILPGKALDLSAKGDGSVVGILEQKGDDVVVTIAGKNGVVMAPESCANMFSGCLNLKQVEFDKSFNTSNVTSMFNMFKGCANLRRVDLSGFNATSVETITAMFNGCTALVSVDLSGFTTSDSLKSANQMFYNCKSLKNIDLSGLTVSGVTTIAQMFQGCENLESVNMSGLKFDNLITVARLFANCKKLKSVDLSSFNPSNLKAMAYVFSNCYSLTEVDLSSMSLRDTTSLSNLFSNCTSLKKVNISCIKKGGNVSYMFRNCSALEEVVISEYWDVSTTTKTGWLTDCNLAIPETYAGETVITAVAA